ncbi:hypothetical protein E2C01_042925 [Portunus trituberculatus]|uniref:Uncharacterized protein n=1 Tax=Portunus trituberculatus TaxID=210409 RepID=A0A5B7FRI9_PORTR|nr:hypothetical protein [Portunus trituberculatus]
MTYVRSIHCFKGTEDSPSEEGRMATCRRRENGKETREEAGKAKSCGQISLKEPTNSASSSQRVGRNKGAQEPRSLGRKPYPPSRKT